MDPGIPVPPPLYGGHERLVYMFAVEYLSLGHDVTILAGPNSSVAGAKTISFGKNDLKRSSLQKFKEILFAWYFLILNRKKFDVVHNFGRLAYLLPILNFASAKIMTYGREVAKKRIKLFDTLPNKNVVYTACSNYCVNTGNIAGRWETVYNAIDFSKYKLEEEVEDNAPLMFLGRMDQEKGLQTAIKIAKETSNMLIIGGNMPHTKENITYFKEFIEPQFDGKKIVYLGALDDIKKNFYLGKAKALLFPIEWEEPFGMVMVEAMACGTPVIGYPRGAVPEVIDQNISGFYSDQYTDLVNKINNINQFERKTVRKTAEKRFSAGVIAKRYLSLIK